MESRTPRLPSAEHPITIRPTGAPVTVRSQGGRSIAESIRALTLNEADYPPVQYIPLQDVDRDLLVESDHASYCPFKGDASYYSVPTGGERSVGAVWVYHEPYAAVAEIKDHVAFYPDRVESIVEYEPANT
jgi:uncharacterized protein (DUF427 family)